MNEKCSIIEGLIFLSGDEGCTLDQLCKSTNMMDKDILDLIDEIVDEYLKDYHGFECVNFGGRYKFISKQKIHEAAENLFSTSKMAVLSQAAMETLAIIAYKQPITRIEIEEIRGVNCDNMVRKLLARNLIKECGRTDGPGKPFLYEVTEEFMDAFKLESLKELPDLPMIEQNMDKELFGEEEMFTEV